MTKRPLNVFQRLVRKWDQVHPYNAAQVMCIHRTHLSMRLDEAWAGALASLGLGHATLTFRSFAYSPPATPPRVTMIPCPVDATQADVDRLIQQHVTTELNRRATPEELPFRAFAIELASHTWLGIVYEHWTADSVSIRMLLRQWLVKLDLLPPSPGRMQVSADGYIKLFGPGPAGWSLPTGIKNLAQHYIQCRHARRVRTDGCRDHTMQFTLHRTPDGWIDGLRAEARRRQCTVNDLFLAALAQTCDSYLRFRSLKKRPDLALGSIVDLRPHSRRDLSGQFSLWLSFVNTLCRESDLNNFDALVQSIAAQTRWHRQQHSQAAGMLWLCLSLILSRFMSKDNAYHYSRKHMPLAAGISNVNLGPTWLAEAHPNLVTDFLRASPTGPVIPLALTPTTLGSRFHVAMSIRSALIDPPAAAAFPADFLSRLTRAMGR